MPPTEFLHVQLRERKSTLIRFLSQPDAYKETLQVGLLNQLMYYIINELNLHQLIKSGKKEDSIIAKRLAPSRASRSLYYDHTIRNQEDYKEV